MIKNVNLIIAIAVLLFSGCAKKKTEAAVSTVTATINNKPYSYSGTRVAAVVNNGQDFTILAENSPTDMIYITIFSYPPVVGTIPFDYNGTKANASYGPLGAGTTGVSINGSITLTSVSPDWVGTFSFTCDDSTRVTNGKFTIIRH